MSYIVPTVSEFKTFFSRDFPFGSDPKTSILDADVTRAQAETFASINESLFGTQEFYSIANNYLSAHNLVNNIKNSSTGIAGQYEWNQSSKGVGSVSVGLSIPQDILNDPQFAFLTRTTYGAKYLEMVYPLLKGVMTAVAGGTSA